MPVGEGMSKIKLSPAQIKVLKALAEPNNKVHFMTGLDAYWFLSSTHGRIRFTTMERLIMADLINVKKDSLGRYDQATITDKGRAYLAEMRLA